MKNYISGKRIVIGFLALLILVSGKLSAQSPILGHTYLGTFNGHSYYLSDCPTTWGDAWSAAAEMGGYLATITSHEEDEFLAPFAPWIVCESIRNSFDRIGGAWIGLLTNDHDQDGICTSSSWSNGEALGYTNWSEIGLFDEFLEPLYEFCWRAAIIGYPDGNNIGFCMPHLDVKWFTNSPASATSRYIIEFDQNPACSQADKTYVCHNGNTICINQNSLQNHLNHGDYAGPCSPCNGNSISAAHNFENADVSNDIQLQLFEKGGDVSFFPNPVSNQLEIRLQHLHKLSCVRIYLATGEKVIEHNFQNENTAAIDVSSLHPGIILVEVRSGHEIWMRKVVKM